MPPLDTTARVETPEHIAFDFELAGPWRRALAYGLDLLVRAALLMALLFVLMLAAIVFPTVEDVVQAHAAVVLLGWFVLEWFYHALFEWLWDGRTPGKRVLQLRVVEAGGYPLGLRAAVLRNLLRAADVLPPLVPGTAIPSWLAGMLTSAADPRFRRLGDLAAGTLVVVDRLQPLRAPAPIEPPPQADELAALPEVLRLSVEERRVLDAFLRRFRLVGAARRTEICRDFADLLAERHALPRPGDPVRFLQLVYARAETSRPTAPRGRP